MAINTNLLDVNGITVTQASVSTASVTPGVGDLVLVAIFARAVTGASNLPTASGNNLTYTVDGTFASFGKRFTVFRGLSGSPIAGAITFDFGGQNQSDFVWGVISISGTDRSGFNGSGGIVQDIVLEDGGDAGNFDTLVTLAAFSDIANGTVGFFLQNFGASVLTPGAGFTKLGQGSGTNDTLMISWRTDNSLAVGATSDTARSWYAAGLEIKAGPLTQPSTEDNPGAMLLGYSPDRTTVSVW